MLGTRLGRFREFSAENRTESMLPSNLEEPNGPIDPIGIREGQSLRALLYSRLAQLLKRGDAGHGRIVGVDMKVDEG